MFSIQISRIVSWDLYWTAVLLKQRVKDKMFYTIPNTLKHGFLSGEQFVLSSSSITKSIILESLTGWQHTHAGLHKHGTHTQMQTDTQTNRNMQDLVWGHTLLHVNSNDVSFWVIFSFQQEHRNNEDIRGQQTERKTKRLCLCVCVCSRHNKASDVHSTFFPSAAFPISLCVSEPCEMPWIIHCLNRCALHYWDNYCSTGGSCHFLPLYPTSASWLILILLKQFEVMWKY